MDHAADEVDNRHRQSLKHPAQDDDCQDQSREPPSPPQRPVATPTNHITPPDVATQPSLDASPAPVDYMGDDGDSGYGDSLIGAASISSRLSSLIQQHEYRHGRRYHPGPYLFPNDEPEQARLDMLHYLFTRLLDDNLFLAPVPEDASILDIGTGTGIWPIQVGDAYPGASVVGVDLSPIQPIWVPPNVRFIVDDVEQDWPDDTYDFIHCRYMTASVRDWPALIRRAYQHVRPGGWLEVQETFGTMYACPPGLEPPPRAPSSPADGSRTLLDPQNPLSRLIDSLVDALGRTGRSMNPAPSLQRWCLDSGFQNVRARHFHIPLGPWSSDPQLREMGSLMALNFSEGVDTFTGTLFTDILGWSPEDVRALNEDVRVASRNTRHTRPMMENIVVIAQKPPGPAG